MKELDIFVSYAHEDEELLDQLVKQLRDKERQGAIRVWSNHNISAGKEWGQEINESLNMAQIILLLISPDFMNSDHCSSMFLQKALEKHHAGTARVIPILLRPVLWKDASFGKLQPLPKNAKPVTLWSNRDKAFLDIAQGIREVIEELKGKLHLSNFCPYRGLSAFREQDAPFFFGRTTFVEQLSKIVRRKAFTAIIGSSGSGKSSIVFAGLVPSLRDKDELIYLSIRPGDRPFQALARVLSAPLEPHKSKIEQLIEAKNIAERLRQGGIALYDILECILQEHNGTRLLLVIDQFEELYTLCTDEILRQRFLDVLIATIQAHLRHHAVNIHIVITLRADFLGYALSYRPLTDILQQNDLKLGPMTLQELQEVIEKPAHKCSMNIEEGLTERILEDIGHGHGKLPLLEFTLTRLWQEQSEGTLKHTTYNKIGRVNKALSVHAETFYETLSEEEQKHIRQIFIQLVHPGQGTEDTRRQATRHEIGEDKWGLITRLADHRLVVSGLDGTNMVETVEIVHEALIDGWERLRQWIEEDRDFRIWQEQLRTTCHLWETKQRDESVLLRGRLLGEAKQWITHRPDEISQAEKEFVRRSEKRLLWEQEQTHQGKEWQSRMVAYTSHGLRTPLNSVHGFIDLLLQNHMGELTDEQRTYLGYTQEGVQQLVSLVEDLLFMTRSDMGQFDMHQEKTFLLPLVESVFTQLQLQARKANVTVSINIPPDTSPLYVDPFRIKQVLLNLMSNSINFTSSGGFITVNACPQDDQFEKITVSDTGCGIPAELKEYVFKPFFQTNTPKNVIGGHGLGLYISKLIVEQHGGSISFDTLLNRGTNFHFTVPLYRP